jgi:hypothetical protein
MPKELWKQGRQQKTLIRLTLKGKWTYPLPSVTTFILALIISYVRQARAYQALCQMSDALDIIAKALHRTDLENDKGLVDVLIELQTDGQGFSNDQATFKNWVLDVLINDKSSAQRLRGLNGEWKRRCDGQLAKWK